MANIICPRISEEYRRDNVFREAAYILFNDYLSLQQALRSDANSHYNMLRASGLLRRLFIDQHSVASYVAKRTALELLVTRYVFRGPKTERKISDLDPLYQIFAPKSAGNHPPMPQPPWDIVQSCEEYLASEIGILGGRSVTPKKIILLYARKLGGVHFDVPIFRGNSKEPEVKDMHRFNVSHRIFGKPPSHPMMKQVASDLFRTLGPIAKTLEVNGITGTAQP